MDDIAQEWSEWGRENDIDYSSGDGINERSLLEDMPRRGSIIEACKGQQAWIGGVGRWDGNQGGEWGRV